MPGAEAVDRDNTPVEAALTKATAAGVTATPAAPAEGRLVTAVGAAQEEATNVTADTADKATATARANSPCRCQQDTLPKLIRAGQWQELPPLGQIKKTPEDVRKQRATN